MKIKILVIISFIVFVTSLAFNFYVIFQATQAYSLSQRQIGFDLCSKQVDKLVKEGKITIISDK